MGISITGWSNKGGTSERACRCGTWQQHWMKFSGKPWPATCSVAGCFNLVVLGGHIINPAVDGERIVPMCDSCNQREDGFALKEGSTVVKANRAQTCEGYG